MMKEMERVRKSYLERSRMLSCLGGSLLSHPGGELEGEAPEDPQEEEPEPELEEDIELVLCRDGIPCTSLRFTTFGNKK